jgi:hypothetical protein
LPNNGGPHKMRPLEILRYKESCMMSKHKLKYRSP